MELPAQQVPLHPPVQEYYAGPKPPGAHVYVPQGYVPKPYGQVNELSSDANYYQPPGELPGHY